MIIKHSERQQKLTPAASDAPQSTRIDVWLWSVRQCKTRSAATAACKGGHVRINGQVVKPAQQVRIGDEVRYRVAGFDRILQVKHILRKRVGAALAQAAYTDSSIPLPNPLTASSGIMRKRGTGRPTKKERRDLQSLLDANSFPVDIEHILDD